MERGKKMKTETIKEQAERIKAETADEERTCEYCGGELKVIPIGDESYDKCVDCGHYNY